jgi:hypothetical protein
VTLRFDKTGRWIQPPSPRVHVRFDERGEIVEFWLRTPASDEEARRGWRAMMLAPTLELCRALLAGEQVPLSQIRSEWVERFGLRS